LIQNIFTIAKIHPISTVEDVQNVEAEAQYRAYLLGEAKPTYISYDVLTKAPKCSRGLNVINLICQDQRSL